jgi:hypothetical protein
MNDCERQDRQTAAVPADDLTRRLLRRATAPIGVIDMRQARDLHLRATLWIGHRAELLDNLKSRCGVDQGAGGTAGTAVTSNAPFQTTGAGRPDLAPAPPSAGRAGSPEAVIGTVSKISSPPAAQHYRVKRPNTHFEPDPSKSLSSQTAATQSGIGRSANLVAAIHPQHQTSETRCGVSSTADRSALPPARTGGRADTRGQAEDKLASRHDLGSAVGALLQVSEAPRTAIAPQMRLPALGLAPTRDGLPGDHTPTLGGPTFRAPLVQRIATPIHDGQTSSRESLAGDEPPRSGSPFAGLLVQRKARHSPVVQTTSSVRSAETIKALPGAEAHSQFGRAVSGEIRREPWPRGFTKIVWHKAEPNGASRETAPPRPARLDGPSHAGGLQNMCEGAESSVSNIVATSGIQALAGNGVGIAAIAEQVSRIIARQLRTERERRGRTR